MSLTPAKPPTVKTVALVGNPNSGKTSLFNQLTGSHQHVANWSGVTVECREGWLKDDGHLLRITDLPGMYSLAAGSPDEAIARDYILFGVGGDSRPDLVIQVIDGGSLERSLLLTMQLLEQELPLVIALNMFDEVRRRGLMINPDQLSRRLGVPVVPTVGNRGTGVEDLVAAVRAELHSGNDLQPLEIRFDPDTERVLSAIQNAAQVSGQTISRGLALGLLTAEPSAARDLPGELAVQIREIANGAPVKVGSTWSEAVTHARYAAISKLMSDSVGVVATDRVEGLTAKLDSVLINRTWGLPIFLIILLLLFEATFTLGSYPMEWIGAGVEGLARLFKMLLPVGFITDLLVDGIVRGIGFVAVFLPNILILLTGIHLLEDSGYMARVAFLMDRLMRTMGLHGKSFIPMLMGFGCNVPALLGARTLENRRDRILTMLLIPLMSCSARLPVYVMVTAAFFPRSGGLVIFGLYLTGTVAAMVLGRVFGKTILKGGAAPFVLELPPYRWPTPKTTLTILRLTFLMYLKRIAGVVVIFAALIWFLGNYPREPHSQAGAAGAALYPPDTSVSFQTAEDQAYGHHTLIYGMGRFIEPAFRPLGFTLPMDIALIAGFIAKEVVVSTLGVLLTGSDASGNATLVENLRRQIPSPAAALAFLVFVLLYTPCLTTIATLHKEVGQKRWTIFAILYQTAAAYLAALLVYNVARLAGMG